MSYVFSVELGPLVTALLLAGRIGGAYAGEVGMIEVSGPNVFQGYWRMPEKTAEELREDGFFITGDLGALDADGRLSIVGRSKDLVISGGYNVYPKEVEAVLDEMPEVFLSHNSPLNTLSRIDGRRASSSPRVTS